MDELVDVLDSVKRGINWKEEKALVEDGLIDSMDLINLIPALEDAFGIEIGMEYMDTENFENLDSMWAMIQEIRG